MKKILYIVFSIGVMLGSSSCEDNDYESILSSTDDYISETGGDYYGGEGIDGPSIKGLFEIPTG